MIKPHQLVWMDFALVLSGCASAQVSSALYGNPSYPPPDPQSVRLLREFPDSGYVKIGEVSASMPLTFKETNATFEAEFKAEAARIGADAVVIREDEPFRMNRTRTTWSEHTYKDEKQRTHTYGTQDSGRDEYGRKVYGIAIKFTK